jgi:hypothetical protein
MTGNRRTFAGPPSGQDARMTLGAQNGTLPTLCQIAKFPPIRLLLTFAWTMGTTSSASDGFCIRKLWRLSRPFLFQCTSSISQSLNLNLEAFHGNACPIKFYWIFKPRRPRGWRLPPIMRPLEQSAASLGKSRYVQRGRAKGPHPYLSLASLEGRRFARMSGMLNIWDMQPSACWWIVVQRTPITRTHTHTPVIHLRPGQTGYFKLPW